MKVPKTMHPSKQQLRTALAAKRKALDFQWLEAASARIVTRFQRLEAFKTSKIVALYKAIGGEVNLEALFSECWKQGKRTCIPVFNELRRIYEMAEVSASTRFRTGHYGIREPLELNLLNLSEIDLIVVPGVGFDEKGNRLGRGGGYYDRMLAGFRGASAGVAFDFQVFPDIPAEKHDQRIQAIVTETKYIKV